MKKEEEWRNWQTWQVSIDRIESETGLDFFSELPDEIEKMVFRVNKSRVYFPAIRYVPETTPALYDLPKLFKSSLRAIRLRLRFAIANCPKNDTWFPMINYCPNPYFVVFATDKSLS
jgi:hypothetical protein